MPCPWHGNDKSIVDIPKFDGNLLSMVLKYHVITRANLVGRTQTSRPDGGPPITDKLANDLDTHVFIG